MFALKDSPFIFVLLMAFVTACDSAQSLKDKNAPQLDATVSKPALSPVVRDCDYCPALVPLTRPVVEGSESNIQRIMIARTETTVAEWRACILHGPCEELKASILHKHNEPARYVSWGAANIYTEWLSEKTGYTYRLPSVAEWRLAAVKDALEISRSDLAAMANYNGLHGSLIPVGSLKPNELGIYDLYGNLAEWVLDCYQEEKSTSYNELQHCTHRIIIGGHFGNNRKQLSKHYTAAERPETAAVTIGFRVIREY